MGGWTCSSNISKIMTHLFYPHPNSLLLLLLPLPIFFFILPPSAAQPNNFLNCPSSMCGNITITYPFWKISNESATQFCGYQGFGINCSDISGQSVPEITLGNASYNVRKIAHDYRSILLADNDVVSSNVPGPNNNCPGVPHGINLESLPLDFSMLNVNLSFHFNCTDGVPAFATVIPCLSNNEGNSCVHIMNSTTEDTDWDEYSCSHEVVTTVWRDNPNRLPNLSTELSELFQRGFELQWRQMDGCHNCEESGGRCGRNNSTTGLLCFCSDGSTRRGDCKGSKINLVVKLVIGGGSALLACVIMLIIFCILKPPSGSCVASLKHKTKDDKNIEAFVMQYGSLTTKRYKYIDIKKMTDRFKDKLGQGGFGQVFKGKLSDGRLVAVKVLNYTKSNGQEFINEVASIGRTAHVNIVTLLGFCFENKKRALVYEYMQNGSLEKFIHSHVPMGTSEHIGAKTLYEIALGVACGLDYLHRGCNTRILHLDIKPHNILLDEDYCPKIADFGLAKLYSRKESIVSMLEARGTIGYIAPEVYNKNFGGVSHKSDVYSYGMLLLEMVGGRKNIDVGLGSGRTSEIYFPDWIYNRLHKNDFLLDSLTTIEENNYARKMTIVGLWCIQPDPNQRPSINEVIEMLEGSMEALKVPPKPFFSSPP